MLLCKLFPYLLTGDENHKIFMAGKNLSQLFYAYLQYFFCLLGCLQRDWKFAVALALNRLVLGPTNLPSWPFIAKTKKVRAFSTKLPRFAIKNQTNNVS